MPRVCFFIFCLLIAEAAQAYVGPGAGFALLGSAFALVIALAAGLLSLLIWPLRSAWRWLKRRKALRQAKVKRIIVLGLDGMDPELAKRWMSSGHLPNLTQLAKTGSFSPLQTTYPSISPVAWASFMTGVDPSRHRIFDFLDRDLRTYKPKLAGSEIKAATRTLRLGSWVIPLNRPQVRNLRKSRTFWGILGEYGIPCNILRVPMTFPPEKFSGVMLSAMCVPDLRGTQGSFTYYTTNPTEASHGQSESSATGGERRLVALDSGMIQTTLRGPKNNLATNGGLMEIPFTVTLQPDKNRALLNIGKQRYPLEKGKYSPWIRLTFKPAPGVRVQGIARFHLTCLHPHFGLYVTPINIDPERPALPISWPTYYATYLSKLTGAYATLGLAEDTQALNEGIIDEEAFLRQALDLHQEREKMFFNALDKSTEGVVVCVFDGTDRIQHMFYRYLDEDHPANRGGKEEKNRHAIRDIYQRADEMVGRVMARLNPDDCLMVISDHGFASFRRGVNLNTWLVQNGLLYLKEGTTGRGKWFEDVDWSQTRAYAFGLAGIYINQRGRESQGIVAPGDETRQLKCRIQQGLFGLQDEESGTTAINELFDNQQVQSSGPYLNEGPDLIVGYNRGYRVSWESAVGKVADELFKDNTKAWSGDHCIDPRLVPGILFSSHPVRSENPAITDIAPTIINLFGVNVPGHITGKPLEVVRPT